MTTATESAEYLNLLQHGTTCPTCTAVDEGGKNLSLPCESGDQIVEAYRQTLRSPAAAPQRGA